MDQKYDKLGDFINRRRVIPLWFVHNLSHHLTLTHTHSLRFTVRLSEPATHAAT